MCVRKHVHVYICESTPTCVYVNTHVHIHEYIYEDAPTCVYVNTYARVHVHICEGAPTCVYVNTHTHVHVHIRTHTCKCLSTSIHVYTYLYSKYKGVPFLCKTNVFGKEQTVYKGDRESKIEKKKKRKRKKSHSRSLVHNLTSLEFTMVSYSRLVTSKHSWGVGLVRCLVR